jgi:hypothetical protein
LSGALLYSAGYLFEAGGSGLSGWRTIQYFISGLIVIFFILVVLSFQVGTGTDETVPKNKRGPSRLHLRASKLRASRLISTESHRALRAIIMAAKAEDADEEMMEEMMEAAIN